MRIDWFVLAEAAAEAVSQVIVVVMCGILLTKAGFLPPPIQRGISKINLYFLTPCLIFTKIASALSWDLFVTFWPIPLFYITLSIVNWTIAQTGSRLLRFSREETRFATASIMFFNNNSLPIALVQSLALSGAAKLLLKDENDTAEAVLARGVSYILFTSVFDNLLRWSFGLNLLSHHDNDDINNQDNINPRNNINNHKNTINNTAQPETANSKIQEVIINVDSHPIMHILPSSDSQTTPPMPPTTPWMACLFNLLKKARGLLQPPLVTAIVALIVGLIRPLHHFLMDPDSKVFAFLIRPLDSCGRAAVPMILLCLGAQVLSFDNTSNPSSAVEPPSTSSTDSLSTAGSSCVPMAYGTSSGSGLPDSNNPESKRRSSSSNDSTKSSSGSNATESSPLLSHSTTSTTLAANQKLAKDQEPSKHPPGSYPINMSTTRHKNNPIPFILFCRMFFSPLITLPAILFIPNSMSDLLYDPIFRLTLVMLSASPTAVNMMQICQINGFFEKKMARLLFWSYCVVGLPVILLWVMVALEVSVLGRH